MVLFCRSIIRIKPGIKLIGGDEHITVCNLILVSDPVRLASSQIGHCSSEVLQISIVPIGLFVASGKCDQIWQLQILLRKPTCCEYIDPCFLLAVELMMAKMWVSDCIQSSKKNTHLIGRFLELLKFSLSEIVTF